MSDIAEKFRNGWLDEDPRIVAAVLSGIFIFVFLNIQLYRSEKRRQLLKQKAIENNTVINAHIVYKHTDRNSDDNTRYYARYKYTVNGVAKEYRINSSITPPDILELYPKNDSGTKLFSDLDRTVNAAIPFNAIAAIAAGIIILLITGYFDQ